MTVTLNFEVKRIRTSVTQQEARVYCNGKLITNFGDEPKIIKPGEKYFGPIIGNWASTTPDAKFVRATIYHKYDDLYHISDGIKKILDEAIERETESSPRRTENDNVQRQTRNDKGEL